MKSFIRTILNTKRIPTIAVVISMLSYVLVPHAMVFAEVMHSTQYRLESDSLNFGGNRSSSASYITEDTMGEVGSGNSNSTNYKNRAGYQQADVVAAQSDTYSGSASGPGSYGSVVNVVEFFAVPLEKSISLNWSYPAVSNIESVKIVRSDKFYPTNMTDGETIFEGSSIGAIDYDVVPGVTYYYALFAKNINGEYSSGVLAQARIPVIGEEPSNISKDPFENVPNAKNVDKVIRELTLADFDFIQDGKLIEHADKTIPINGGKDLTISLAYGKVPEILKTIAVSLFDPEDDTKVFTFLLRVNKDKTAYTATIGPLLKSGDYKLNIIILDYKNQGLKRLNGDLRAVVFEGAKILSYFNNISINILILSISFILLLILILAAILKKKKTALASLMLLIALGTGIYFSVAKAAINKEINYQGKLFDSAGDPVTDGSYNMRFKLYTSAGGATPLWSETLCKSPDAGSTCDGTGTNNQVTVTDGLFSVMLGNVTALDSVDFNQSLYLSVEIGGDDPTPTWDGEMTPRKKIGAVPAAFEADKLDGISSEQFLRSDAQNATTSSTTFLNVLQSGAGKVAEFFGQGSASVLSILSDGKVGIGTTTPTDTLSVNGPIYLANTTPTATGNRLYANGGDLYYAGNLIGGATTGNWTSNGTDVWRPTGNVGVGTTSPAKKLQVYVTTSGDGIGIDGTTNPAFNLRINGVTKGNFAAETTGNAWFTGAALNDIALTASSGNLALVTGTTARLYVSAAGNVGIGTTSPYAKLSVTSTSVASTTLALRPVSSQTANIVDIFNGSGSLVSVINTSGFIGLGSTTPTGMLTITNTGTTYPSFVVEDSTSPDASPFLIDNAGLVGIGTSTPDTPLTIYSGTAIDKDAISAHGFNGSTAEKTMIRLMNGNRGYNWGIRFGAARDSFGGGNSGDAFVVNTKIQNGAEVERFRISKDGYVSIGSTTPFSAALSVYNNLPSKNVLLLDALSGTTVPILDVKLASTSKFVIDSSGKVGINTASPLENFDLSGGYLNISAGSSACNNCVQPSGIKLASDASTNAAAPIISNVRGANSADQGIDFRTYFSGTINAMRIIGNGNVGIGSSTPYSQLSVGGNSISKTLFALDALSGQTQPILDVKLASTSKFMVDSSGNVGIGTSTPGQKISVAGDILGNNFIGSYFTGTSTTVSTFNGPLNTSGTTGGYRIDNTLILQASSTNFSTLLGQSAGAATLADGLYNTAIGYQALMTATSTDGNTGVGYQALKANTVGANNTALGYISLAANTTGSSNTAVGYRSLRNNTTGDFNTALGTYALDVNTTGGYNTSIGFATLTSNTTGNYNTANGYEALLYNTTGSSNTASGYFSLAANTTGNSNTVSGHNSMSNNITGSENTSIGYGSLRFNQSATSSTAFGFAAGYGAGAPYSNQGGVYIGHTSGYSAMNGSDYNTLIGYKSGYGITTGARNVFLGNSTIAASYNQVTTGSNNISIGNDVAVPSATANNQLSIGNLIYGSGLDGTGATVSSGYIGIGSTTPYAKLAITNTGSDPSFVVEDSTSPDTTPFIIDASGKVGIGTTSPMGTLSIGSGQLILQNGSATTPSTGFADEATSGIYRPSLGVFGVAINGAGRLGINASNGVFVPSTGSYGFNSSSGITSADTNISRFSSGVLAVGTGSQGSVAGTLLAANIGVGVTTPTANLVVSKSYAEPAAGIASTTVAVFSNNNTANASSSISILSRSSAISSINFGTQLGERSGFIDYGIAAGSYQGLAFGTLGAERVRIDGNGYVGIGTSTPRTIFDIASASAPTLSISNTTNGTWAIGDILGALDFYSSDVNDNFPGVASKISSVIETDTGGSNVGLALSTASIGTLSEKLRISSSGNLGIGTTTPTTLLQVTSASESIISTNRNAGVADGTDIGSLRFMNLQNYNAGIQALASGTNEDAAHLRFMTSPSGGSVLERLRITSDGYVGIGTTTPALQEGGASGDKVLVVSSIGTTNRAADIELAGFSNSAGIGNAAGRLTFTRSGDALARIAGYRTAAATDAGQLSFLTAASGANLTEKMVIDPSGLVGIGTTTPYAKLAITNTGSDPSFVVEDSTSPDSTPFIIDASGNVGIASSTPGAKLSIFTSSDVNNTYIDSSSNNNFALTVRNSGGIGKGLTVNVGNTGSDATIISANNLSGTNFFTVSDGNSYFQNGNVGIGSTSPYASLSITNTGTSPSFVVEDSTSPDGSPFIIDASGNVGIGTASLTAKLNIEGGAVYVNNGNVTTGTVFYNKRNALFDTGSTDTVGINIIGRTGQTADLFQIGSTTAVGDIFTVKSNGNIGIGTTTPYANLSVLGGSTASDTLLALNNRFRFQGDGVMKWGVTANAGLLSWGATNAIVGSQSGYDLSLYANGGEKMKITTGGLVGISSTTPYASLSVTNTGSNPSFVVEDSSPDSTPFIIDASGNVGVGTAAPSEKLSLYGASGLSRSMTLSNDTTYYKLLETLNYSGSDSYNMGLGGDIFLQYDGPAGNRTTTLGVNHASGEVIINGNVGIGTTSPTDLLSLRYTNGNGNINLDAINTSNSVGVFFSGGNNFGLRTNGNGLNFVTGSASSNTTRMLLDSNGNIGIGSTTPWGSLSVTNTGTSPSFVVEDSTSPDTTPFIIDASGNVGVGTINPGAKLEIANTTAGFKRLLTINGASGTDGDGGYIEFAASTVDGYGAQIGGIRESTGGLGSLVFRTGGNTQAERMRITNAGNVGIGTTSPLSILNVSGSSPILSLGDYTGSSVTPDLRFYAGISNYSWRISHNGAVSGLEFSRSNNTGSASFNSPTFVILNTGNVGVATTSPFATFAINPTAGSASNQFVIGSSTATSFVVDNGGKVGIGTANPNSLLNLAVPSTAGTPGLLTLTNSTVTDGNGVGINFNISTNPAFINASIQAVRNLAGSGNSDLVFSTSNASSPIERLRINYLGNVGIGTTSPYAALSVVGNVVATNFTATSTSATSTFAGGVDFGSGNFSYDTYSGVTSINSLQTGNLNFDTDAGLVSWTDMALSSTPNGAPVGYTAFLNGSSTISVYGVSAGNGWLQDDYPRVAIGSTTAPSSKLTVFGNGTANGGIFELVNSASTTLMKVLDNGNIGIASTSPWRTFSVSGTVALNGLTSSATGNALCITASKEVTDSGGASCTPSSIRFKENVLPMDPGYALGQLAKLSVVNFDYKEKQQFETNHSYGMIAEDVEKIDKNLVDYGYDGKPVSLHFEKITGLLVQAVQEQQGQIGNLGSTTSRLDLTTNQLVASSTLGMTNMDIRLNNMDSVIASLSASTTLISAIASTTVDLIASSTANSILESKSFVERVFITFMDSLEDTVAKIKSVFVGDLHIENKLCVDDVCVNKEQLKALLIQATASSTPNSNVNSTENNNINQNNNVEENSNNNNPVQENNNQATTTPTINPPTETASSTPSTSSGNLGTPEEAPAPAPELSPEPASEVTPPPTTEAPAPAPEPSPEPAPEPAPEASSAPQA